MSERSEHMTERTRELNAEEALKSAQRLIDAAFHNEGREKPTFRVPATPDDDDLFLCDYIKSTADLQQRLAASEAEEARQRKAADAASKYADECDRLERQLAAIAVVLEEVTQHPLEYWSCSDGSQWRCRCGARFINKDEWKDHIRSLKP